ncbi:MAG: amidohydrolase family protein [Gammaproteobacteria bacterium]|nr:amidohydrolase family protein [Gammaproteobacteria bacterium]
MYDLLIKNGVIIDGTGNPKRDGAIAVKDGLIVKIDEKITGSAKRVIDANGAIIAPGFIDIHTHYDGQATWDDALEPSSCHGVTTVVMGNCGVGFAPLKRGTENALIELMEGVEDIPGTALHEGIDFTWETFPEYLDALDSKQWSMDVATQVPHGALRVFIMGERGINNEPANENDVKAMAKSATEAMEAGALGFSSSRILGHMSLSGQPVPGTFAHEDELFAIAKAMKPFGTVFEVVPGGSTGRGGLGPPEGWEEAGWQEEILNQELIWMNRLSVDCKLPVTFFLIEYLENPNAWREAFSFTSKANSHGARLYPQVGTRPAGAMLSWQTYHPFIRRPTYLKIADLPWPQRYRELCKPQIRAAILAEKDLSSLSHITNDNLHKLIQMYPDRVFILDSPVNYEQPTEQSIAGLAKSTGQSIEALFYDNLMKNEGCSVLILLVNYLGGNSDSFYTMLSDPNSVIGLADAGAHCRFICDASCTTWLLTHWTRDRVAKQLPLEYAVKKHTSDCAELYGLSDRGTLEIGKKADLNVIDFNNLTIDQPYLVHDLPAGGARYLQKAHGYIATIVNGTVTREQDEDTGERPGRLVRYRR